MLTLVVPWGCHSLFKPKCSEVACSELGKIDFSLGLFMWSAGQGAMDTFYMDRWNRAMCAPLCEIVLKPRRGRASQLGWWDRQWRVSPCWSVVVDASRPGTWEAEADRSLWVQGHHGQHREIQDSQNYTERPCLSFFFFFWEACFKTNQQTI